MNSRHYYRMLAIQRRPRDAEQDARAAAAVERTRQRINAEVADSAAIRMLQAIQASPAPGPTA